MVYNTEPSVWQSRLMIRTVYVYEDSCSSEATYIDMQNDRLLYMTSWFALEGQELHLLALSGRAAFVENASS